MSDDSGNLWYQLGFAVERARDQPTRDRVKALGEKLAAFRAGGQATTSRNGGGSTTSGKALIPTRSRDDDGAETLDWLLAALSGGLATRILRHWSPRGAAGPGLAMRGAAAGAAAAIFQELVHVIMDGDDSDRPLSSSSLVDRALSGTARGLLFALVVEPRVPGHRLLRGAVFGTADYLLSPVGGLGRLLGKATPWGKVPVLREVLAGESSEDDSYLEHLIFGVALALMAGETLPED